MKTNVYTFVPFQHINLDYIKGVIGIARTQNNGEIQGTLTSTLIYMNAVDYIAEHLLENLIEIDCLVTNQELNGVVFRNDGIGKNLALHTVISELERYDFPNKRDFMSELEKFKEKRNKVAHRLLSLTLDELNEIDNDLMILRQSAENLLSLYDTIVRGVSGTWSNYVSKFFVPQGQIPNERQQGEVKVQDGGGEIPVKDEPQTTEAAPRGH